MIDNKYDAITIDTNLVVREGFQFESGLLAQLTQFKNHPANFVLSDVVLREIQKHLIKNTRSARDAMLSAFPKASKCELLPEEDQAALDGIISRVRSAEEAANSRLMRFLIKTGARIATTDFATLKDVVTLYFEPSPPFSSSGKKKEEFPDAIALLSLEGWAKASNKRILAVSDDQGWLDYCDKSDRIDALTDFGGALQVFQEHAELALQAVRSLLSRIETGAEEEMRNELEEILGDDIHGMWIDPETESDFDVALDQMDLTLNDFAFEKADGQYDVTIVRIDEDALVAQVSVVLNVEATGWFTLYANDPISGEKMVAGHTSAEVDAALETELLLTLHGTLAVGEAKLELLTAELDDTFTSIDFGRLKVDPRQGRDSDVYESLPQLPFDEFADDGTAH